MSTLPAGQILIAANVSHANTGGGWPHVRGLARGLRELGHGYTLLCGGDNTQASDADFDRIIARRVPQQPLIWRLGPIASLRFWQREFAAAANECAAVIALSAGMAVAAKRAVRCPVIYAPAIVTAVEHPHWWLHKRVERWAFRQSDGVLLTTQAVRETVECLFGKLPAPIGLAPLGIDHGKLRNGPDPRAKWGIPANARVLLTVGAINENKGQLRIAQALAAHGADDWWWVVLGDGPERASFEAWIRQSPIADRVVLAGHTKELGAWYKRADLLVAASRHETFGLAIAEALSAGLPVVLPKNEPPRVMSPLAPIVTSHELGAVFSRNAIDELYSAIRTVLSQPDPAAIAQRAQAWAQTALSWTSYAQAACDLIETAGQLPQQSVTANPQTTTAIAS